MAVSPGKKEIDCAKRPSEIKITKKSKNRVLIMGDFEGTDSVLLF